MQTYFISADPTETAESLGAKELIQQIDDVLLILVTINQTADTGFSAHPVVKMWRGHEVYLAHYGLIMCDEALTNRPVHMISQSAGVIGEITQKRADIEQHLDWSASGEYSMEPPPWVRDPNLHKAHKSELLRANPSLYDKYWPDVPMDVPCYWPVK